MAIILLEASHTKGMKWLRTFMVSLLISQFQLNAQYSNVADYYGSGLQNNAQLPQTLWEIGDVSSLAGYKVPSMKLLCSEQDNTPGEEVFTSDPDFWLSTSVNLVGTGLFLTRVHHPPSAKWFGYGTKVLGLPALALGISDLYQNQTDFSTYANLNYAAWALYAITVDHILDINYRDPFKPAIIVPYAVSYYIAVGSMSAGQYENGWVPWIISGAACIINVSASFYARSKGADRY